ncbi:MAG: FGGY-family carbohydrate kinase, partial [Candidatus Omnitrophota bacterium]
SIFGITRGTKARHLVRAALEAMAYQTKDVLTAMKKDSGIMVKNLKVDGGAASNNFLCQFQADILGINVIRPKIIETTSLGAAYLAGLATGYWKDAEKIKKYWKVDRIFKPQISRKRAEGLYRGWREAVKRTLTTYTTKLK